MVCKLPAVKENERRFGKSRGLAFPVTKRVRPKFFLGAPTLQHIFVVAPDATSPEQRELCRHKDTTMPFLPPPAAAGKKRRRELQPEDPSKVRSKSTLKHVVLASAPQDQINLLETQIYESRRHYNNIVTLLSLTKPGDTKRQTRVAACVALCKVYCRLLASRAMVKSKDTAEEEIVIIQWLRERYSEFSAQLLQNLSNPTECESSLTLLFQLVKYESNQEKGLGESVWKQGVFGKLVDVLVGLEESGEVLPLFIEEVNRYDDIRYYTFKNIA